MNNTDDTREQLAIQDAIFHAIPVGSKYINIIKALLSILQTMVRRMEVDDIDEGGMIDVWDDALSVDTGPDSR